MKFKVGDTLMYPMPAGRSVPIVVLSVEGDTNGGYAGYGRTLSGSCYTGYIKANCVIGPLTPLLKALYGL